MPASPTPPADLSMTGTVDHWTTVTLPVLDAIGRLEEAGTPIDYAAVSEASGIDEARIDLLVRRLSRDGDGKQWLDGVFQKLNGGGFLAHIEGLGPLGMQAVRGFPGQEAMIATLERLADAAETDEERGLLTRAASLLRGFPAELFAVGSVEAVKRLAGH
jgi:hypothetical protein